MQVPGLAEENQKLEAAASEIDSAGGLAKSRRKAMQFENYKDKYQKEPVTERRGQARASGRACLRGTVQQKRT